MAKKAAKKTAKTAPTRNVIRSKKSGHPFARGHSAVLHVRDPEGWVRGKASLDRNSGRLTMTLGLETDSVASGVRGRMSVYVFDDAGNEIATVKMGKDVGIPGKAPGKSRSEDFTMRRRIPRDVAARATSVEVDVDFTGKQFGLFGVDLDVIADAIKVLVAVLADDEN